MYSRRRNPLEYIYQKMNVKNVVVKALSTSVWSSIFSFLLEKIYAGKTLVERDLLLYPSWQKERPSEYILYFLFLFKKWIFINWTLTFLSFFLWLFSLKFCFFRSSLKNLLYLDFAQIYDSMERLFSLKNNTHKYTPIHTHTYDGVA